MAVPALARIVSSSMEYLLTIGLWRVSLLSKFELPTSHTLSYRPRRNRHLAECGAEQEYENWKEAFANELSCKIVNPFGKEHGAPSDSNRHVGDLGNIKTDAQGNAKGSIEDNLIKLIGESSVLGVRSVKRLVSASYPLYRLYFQL